MLVADATRIRPGDVGWVGSVVTVGRTGVMTRVAVVTGGSAGLGRATVRELAARGWDVAVLARGRDGVDAAVAEVEAAGRRGLALVADVADREAVEAAADRVEQELGRSTSG